MSLGRNPTVFIPITCIKRDESGRQEKKSRYNPYTIHNHHNRMLLDQHSGNSLHDYHYSKSHQPSDSTRLLSEKPIHVKRLSIETLINDSDEDGGLQSNQNDVTCNSTDSGCISTSIQKDQESSRVSKVSISELVNSNESYLLQLRDQELNNLWELKNKLNTVQGYRYACAGMIHWLRNICYDLDSKIRDSFNELLVDVLTLGVKEEYNAYSAYSVLEELQKHNAFKEHCILDEIKPWIDLLRRNIASKKQKSLVLNSEEQDHSKSSLERLEQRFDFAKRFAMTCGSVRPSVQRFPKVIGTFIDRICVMPNANYVNVRFSMSREMCRKFDSKISMTEFILQLYCYEHNDIYKKLKWPDGLEVQINSFNIPINPDERTQMHLNNFFITSNHPPTISNHIKMDTNVLNFRFKSRRIIKYNIEIRIIALLTRQKVIETALTDNITLNAAWDDPSFKIMVMNMNCYLTGKKMDIPVKGQNCRHMQLFDLRSWLNSNADDLNPKCPVCELPLTLDKIDVYK